MNTKWDQNKSKIVKWNVWPFVNCTCDHKILKRKMRLIYKKTREEICVYRVPGNLIWL